MKCLIIAAGQGTRLRTVAQSKPLAQVDGVALIEHVARSALAGGASSFLVATGYEAERVEAFLPGLSDRLGAPVEAVRNPEWRRPNGLSVLAAADRLGGEFLLLMSDHLFDPAIARELLAGRRPEAALTLACDHRLDNVLVDADDVTKVALGADGRIARIGKKLATYQAFDTGIFLATPALFGAIRKSLASGGAGSLSEGVQVLADEGRADAFDIGDRWWIDVDDEAAMRKAEASFPRPRRGVGDISA